MKIFNSERNLFVDDWQFVWSREWYPDIRISGLSGYSSKIIRFSSFFPNNRIIIRIISGYSVKNSNFEYIRIRISFFSSIRIFSSLERREKCLLAQLYNSEFKNPSSNSFKYKFLPLSKCGPSHKLRRMTLQLLQLFQITNGD